jgi:hypothetical protein
MKFTHRIFALGIAAILALGLSLAGNPKATAAVEPWYISATVLQTVATGPCPGDGHPGKVQVLVGSRDAYGNPLPNQSATVTLFDRFNNPVETIPVITGSNGTVTHDFTVALGGHILIRLLGNSYYQIDLFVDVWETIAEPIEEVVLSLTPVTPVGADSAVDYVATGSMQVCGALITHDTGLEFDIPAPATILPLPGEQDWVKRVYLRAEQAATLSLVARSTVYQRQRTATVQFGVAAPTIETATSWGITGKVFQEVPSVELTLPTGSVPATATATVTNCHTEGTDPPTIVCDWSWPANGAQLGTGEFSAIAVDSKANESAPAISTLGSGPFTLTLKAQLSEIPYFDPCISQFHQGRVVVQLSGNLIGQEVEVRGVSKTGSDTVNGTLTTDSQGNAEISWPVTSQGWSFTAWIGPFQVADGETVGEVVTDFAPYLTLSQTPQGPLSTDDPNGYTLTATVTCGAGIPLANVQVDFTSNAGLQQVNTDADGKASIQVTSTEPGDVPVNVTAYWQMGRSEQTTLSFIEPSVAPPGGGGLTAETGGRLANLIWPMAGLLALAGAAGLLTTLGLRARRR